MSKQTFSNSNTSATVVVSSTRYTSCVLNLMFMLTGLKHRTIGSIDPTLQAKSKQPKFYLIVICV